MAEVMYEGVVKDGVIRLSAEVSLPENAIVYVTVPELSPAHEQFEVVLSRQEYRIMSPHLADPVQASRFVMEMRETNRADV